MKIFKDGICIYNSIDNAGTSNDASLGSRYALGLISSLTNNVANNYYNKDDIQNLMAGKNETIIVPTKPVPPSPNTYYLVGNDTDGYILYYYDKNLNEAKITERIDLTPYLQKVDTFDKLYGTDNLGNQTTYDKADFVGTVNGNNKIYATDNSGQNTTLDLHSQKPTTPSHNAVYDEAYVQDELDKKEVVFRYTTMPTADADYLGKIIQYIGLTTANYKRGYFYECIFDEEQYKWVEAKVQSEVDYYDLSHQLTGDEYNTENFNFANAKLNCVLGLTSVNAKADYKNVQNDIIATDREGLHLPELPEGYSYIQDLRLRIIQPSGYWTCMANKEEFYNSEGSHYIDPNIGKGAHFTVKTLTKLEDTYDSKGNPIIIGQQLQNTDGNYIVKQNGEPLIQYYSLDFNEGDEIPKVYTIKYVSGEGYKHYDAYYNSEGQNPVSGSFYELNEVTPIINKQYLYQCVLYDTMLEYVGEGYMVDSDGYICTVEVKQSALSSELGMAEYGIFKRFKYGSDGTVTFTRVNKPFDSTTEVNAKILNRVLKIPGIYPIKSIDLSLLF